MGKTKTIATIHFGEIQYDEDSVFTFPDGIPGFEQLTKFVILTIDQYIPFQWLLSLDNPTLTFPIIRPNLICPEYEPKVSDYELRPIRLRELKDAEIYSITTIGAHPEEVTANLRAPLIINRRAKLGKQCILAEDTYSLRFSVLKNDIIPQPGKAELCLFSRGE